jgi:flagellar biosynthetic protein FlhB
MSGEKTEKPTPQKKKEARKEGRATARTPDLGAWAGMFAATIVVPMAMRSALDRAAVLLHKLPAVIAQPDPNTALHLLKEGAIAGATAAAPVCGGLLAIGLVAAAAQGGMRPTMKLLVPKFNRLNPMSGLKKSFGPQGWWEAAKALVKVLILAVVVYSTVRGVATTLMLSGSLSLSATLTAVTDGLIALLRSAAGAGLVLAAADWVMVRRRVNKGLRMSKQEIKDEYKKTEGDPHVKGHIRQRQYAAARSRMMADVPKADVVVVNPTHVAVALRYDPGRGAPRVLAKGSGTVAAKIRERASEHRIPMVQDVPLARALYAGCEVGAEIPAEFYGAVARVLAFVMGLKAKGSAAGLHRPFGTAAA